MASSENESWRISDAPKSPNKDEIESVRGHGNAESNPRSTQQNAEPLPAVEIRYPKAIEDDARAYKGREERRERWKLLLETLAVVGILAYGAMAYRQWHTMLAATDNSTKALQATERAYVSTERASIRALRTTERAQVIFGSENGELAEFIDNPMPGQKRIIVLHFFNSGSSTARHLAVHPVTESDDTDRLPSRHRFQGPRGDIVSTGTSIERDLAGGAEHLEYIVSPWSQRELAEHMDQQYSIFGQYEYCDIFGTYHCQGFSTNYLPNIKRFVPGPAQSCVVKRIRPNDKPGKDYKEINPCEQPDESEPVEAPVSRPQQ